MEFEYSPLGKVFNEGLDESNKKERLFKRLKYIESKNEHQLEAIKDQGEKQLQIFTKKRGEVDGFENISFKNKLKSKGIIEYNKTLKQDEMIGYENLICIGSGKHRYDFTIFLNLKTFADSIYDSNFLLKAAKVKQRNMEDMIVKLDYYNPTKKIIYGTKKK